MIRRISGARLALLVGTWLAFEHTGLGQELVAEASDDATVRANLERAGATIRAVHINADNVFDPNSPDEDKRLYRLANRVHVLTRPQVIDSTLLFHEGDPFSTRLLEESERSLRALPFLAEATVEPRGYDAETNTVEIDVRVRDAWTLATDMKFNHTGGATDWGAGVEDRNLFGRGKAFKLSYRSHVDRDEVYLGYTDPNLLGSRVRLSTILADASDGYRRVLDVQRPFFSLDTRWSLGGSVSDEQRVDKIYDLGDEVDQFQHDSSAFTLQGGLSKGLIDGRTQRWLLGVTAQEDRFRPTLTLPQPVLLPADRKLVYPWIGWQLVKDDYREMTELNDIGRTEDISLGLNLFFNIGFANTGFGADRDATLFRAVAETGWEPGGPGRLLLLSAGGSARNEADGLHDSQMYVNARYFRRNLERHLFSVSLSALAANRLDPDQQVLLGGDNGLRGYPLRYQAGEQRAILSVEQRFFTDLYPWRLFRVGYAVFADLGSVRGRDPRASPSQGTLYDVGIGLRLSSPRASGRSIVHLDLAFPLNADPTIDNVQFVVETKGSF